MVRGKTIGALDNDTKVEFQIIALKDSWVNYNELMQRMISLYHKYNKQYEKELKGQHQN